VTKDEHVDESAHWEILTRSQGKRRTQSFFADLKFAPRRRRAQGKTNAEIAEEQRPAEGSCHAPRVKPRAARRESSDAKGPASVQQSEQRLRFQASLDPGARSTTGPHPWRVAVSAPLGSPAFSALDLFPARSAPSAGHIALAASCTLYSRFVFCAL